MNTNDVYVDHCPVCVRQHTFCCDLHSIKKKKKDGGKVIAEDLVLFYPTSV